MRKSIAVFLAIAGIAAAGQPALAQKRAFRPDEAQFVPERHREPTAAQLDLLLAQ